MDEQTLIQKHEGLRLTVYTDTRGHPTIGYGRALDVKGISQSEALFLLHNDITLVRSQLSSFPWFARLDGTRQAALIDMAYNLGFGGFGKFQNMLDALMKGDYDAAADAMLDSEWARQVPNRANEDADLIRKGAD